ncbi:hypothetical protein K0I63_12140 [Shewanella rhizosphaerae]|uniref:hypothetical protein n=1 Tax=Shewanella rhizosphaerae TaxID=2864207 RepID=UPI001C660BBF|nr:hypothetical protein [Shewanella rhizosphaerae]QYK11534.1 hypothetical protein K0I63_12140 [Shewanella rhizosphaerae]
MKLNKLTSFIACSALLSFTLAAAPTDVRQIDFNDNQLKANLIQDGDKDTKLTLDLEGKQHHYSFSNDEIKDEKLIRQKLAKLPKETQDMMVRLLKQIDGDESHYHYLRHSELSEADQARMDALTKKMAKKEAELANHIAKIEVKVAAKSAEMEAKRAEMERKAAELEAKAREFEVIIDTQDGEFNKNIELLSDDIAEIATEIAEIEMKYHGDGEREFVVIRSDDEADVEQLIQLIETGKLSDDQRRKLQQALNNDNRK